VKKWTGLHLASSRGNLKTAQLLLEKGSDPQTRDPDEGTPLHTAAAYGRNDVCKILVQAGADINARDIGGDTPLDMALMYKKQETARVLSELGAVSGSGMPNDELIKRAEWIPDPLWPDGYKQNFFEMSDDEEDDDEFGNMASSELERRIYDCSTNISFADRLVAQAEAIPDDRWVQEQPPPDMNLTIPGWNGGPICEEPVDLDTSSGWDERILNLKPRRLNVDDDESVEYPVTFLRSGLVGGAQGGAQDAVPAWPQHASVSTCDDVSLEKGGPKKEATLTESSLSEEWPSSTAGAANKKKSEKTKRTGGDEEVSESETSISEDWSSTEKKTKRPAKEAGKPIAKTAPAQSSDEETSISEDWSSSEQKAKPLPKKAGKLPSKPSPKKTPDEETSISDDWSSTED
jgi:hypothetical protein